MDGNHVWLGTSPIWLLTSDGTQSLQASLASATASISSVPDVSAYISALTPVVSAYGAMPANTFTDLQTRVTSLDSTIQQVGESH